MILDATITGILMMVTRTVAMMVCTTEITGIITLIITMETMIMVMECGESNNILEVSFGSEAFDSIKYFIPVWNQISAKFLEWCFAN
jgi:hypothetical protein